jgi:hypothetical protein
MKTITLHRATHDGHTQQARTCAITLPMIPGVDVTTDRSETTPRGRVVRSAEDWVKADRMLNRVARRGA